MPFLSGFFASVFSGVYGFLTSFISARVALASTLILMIATATAAFFVAIKALVAGVAGTISNEWLLMGIFACLPSNFETCLAACIGADFAALVYRWKLNMIRAAFG